MKLCALILSFVLSFLSGGREADFIVSESPSAERIADFSQNRDICFSNYTYEPATEIVELRGPRAEKLICKL